MLISVGCSSMATIRTTEATTYEGVIEKSDRENIYVNSGGGARTISRTDINYINHPGYK
jgi:hypothetical protein